jgi:hypothetical protein
MAEMISTPKIDAECSSEYEPVCYTWISVDMGFRIDIHDGCIDIESFYRSTPFKLLKYLLKISSYCLTSWSRLLVEKLSPLVSQEIVRLLWYPEVHYCIHSRPIPIVTLRTINSGHISSHPTSFGSILMLSWYPVLSSAGTHTYELF